MARPSTVARLPAEQRDLIRSLRERGRTLDEILAQMHALGSPISRSSLGRHVQLLDAASPEGLGIAVLALRRDVNRIGRELAALRQSLRR